jgi:predicted metalloprotease
MRWESGRRSENVIDARGRGTKLAAGGGIGMAVLALVVYLLGGDPSVVTDARQPAPQQPAPGGQATDAQSDFVKVVLGDTEDTWGPLF